MSTDIDVAEVLSSVKTEKKAVDDRAQDIRSERDIKYQKRMYAKYVSIRRKRNVNRIKNKQARQARSMHRSI